MKRIVRLKKEALSSSLFRGHKMSRFITFKDCAISHCKVCGKSVVVDASPPPNGIDVGGKAVALGCVL